jgi:hypothetical protein
MATLGLALAACAAPATAPTPEPAPEAESAPTDAPTCPSFTLASTGLPETGEWRSHPAIGDVNGDGLGDIAALARKGDGPVVFLGDGLGGWKDASSGLKFPRGFSCGIGTRFADFDLDGKTDLAIADHCRGVRVYRGDGGTSWRDASEGIPENVEGFNDVDAGDIDGDGILDLVGVSAFSRGFLVLRGRTGGAFEVVWDSGLPEVGSGFEIELTDADGDGRLDVVASFNPVTSEQRVSPPPPAKVWLQGPDGRFRPAQTFTVDGRYFGVATVARRDRAALDVYAGLTGTRAGLWGYEPADTGGWTERGPLDDDWFEKPRPGFLGVEAADVDADGCTDLLLGGGRPMGVWLALGDCAGGWRPCPEATLPHTDRMSTVWGVTAGDLNGDGRTDVVAAFGAATRGAIRAWLQSGPARRASAP